LNTGALAFERYVIPTQYNGDMDNIQNLNFLLDSLDFLMKTYKIRISNTIIAHDLHPDYNTTILAQKFEAKYQIPRIAIQHHHSHIASVMLEHKLKNDEEVLGIALDGLGFGDDGTLWGGEILLANYEAYKRIGHLQYLPLPGGEVAIEYPTRIIIGILKKHYDDSTIAKIITKSGILKGLKYGLKEVKIIEKIIGKSPITSGVGRYLDAISSLLGICYERTYEGEPAMKLESIAYNGLFLKDLEPEIAIRNKKFIILTEEVILKIIDRYLYEYSKRDIAYSVQYGLGRALAKIIKEYMSDMHLKIAVSGGAAVNDYIIKGLEDSIKNRYIIYNKQLPPGDGGISSGQAIIAAFKYS